MKGSIRHFEVVRRLMLADLAAWELQGDYRLRAGRWLEEIAASYEPALAASLDVESTATERTLVANALRSVVEARSDDDPRLEVAALLLSAYRERLTIPVVSPRDDEPDDRRYLDDAAIVADLDRQRADLRDYLARERKPA